MLSFTMFFQALDVQYQVNGRRQSHTCSQRSTLLEVLEELSIPGTNLGDACVLVTSRDWKTDENHSVFVKTGKTRSGSVSVINWFAEKTEVGGYCSKTFRSVFLVYRSFFGSIENCYCSGFVIPGHIKSKFVFQFYKKLALFLLTQIWHWFKSTPCIIFRCAAACGYWTKHQICGRGHLIEGHIYISPWIASV
jgi:hypothetical protein